MHSGNDPLVGVLTYKTQTRVGQRLPWLLIGSTPLLAFTLLLFVPPANPSVIYFTA
ncbi:MAG TPA: hypothetical protein DER02_05035 [Gammaproteobacteria bacterium]|nr:hypothetical protein [Gammaproteobacteria bacterium]